MKTSKHAYLIMAHSNFEILRILLNCLNKEYNDLYVHIDKKSKVPLWIYSLKWPNLFIVENRLDVRWGDFSQIKLELYLFQLASEQEQYEYYHLLSGVDLPIKNIDYIYDFFHTNKGKEFVGFSSDTNWEYKVCKYHFFTRYYRNQSQIIKKLRFFSEFIINSFITRSKNYNTFKLKKGANWVSITDNFCRYLLSKKDYIYKRFQFTCCADEIFLQSILWNSSFRKNIYSLKNEYDGCMREIDWERGEPYIWGEMSCDFSILSKSDRIFARKFDENKSRKLLYQIKSLLR